MKCLVFSTHRQIRDFISKHDNLLLPKLYTIDDFFKRLVIVPKKAFIDQDSRVLYLYRAIETIDIGKLGFEKSFLSFAQNSSFIFRFFEELFAEQVTIDEIQTFDTYADFEDHLLLLKEIYSRYKNILENEGLVDRITIDNFRLEKGFLEQFEQIDLYVEGYLSRFEIEVLKRIETPLYIHFVSTPFNKKLIDRLGIKESLSIDFKFLLNWQSKKIIHQKPQPKLKQNQIEVAALKERINQVPFALKQIERFIEDGANPDYVAVILPDESFAEYLKLFDTHKNFNYAMGTPFVQSNYYRRLSNLYDTLTDSKNSTKKRVKDDELLQSFAKVDGFKSFIEFLQKVSATSKELEIIDEELFLFQHLAPLLEDERPINLLFSWLRRIENLKIDDIGGGRITVMGVLESRGKEFDGVVIVDFNEDIVPKVSQKDLFLNSTIRKYAKMPTRKEKEDLQKNYYYRLLQNSKRVAICYVKNEESLPSRFLFELGLKESEIKDNLYRPIIAPYTKIPQRYDVSIIDKNPFFDRPKLTPSRLKDYLTCLRRFYYRYVLEIKEDEETKELNIGTLIHKALEQAAKKKEKFSSWELYCDFVMDCLYKAVSSSLQKFEISLEWEPKLRAFCQADFESLKGFKQVGIEEWYSVDFAGFELSSKIDRVDLGKSVVRLIDYKTTRSINKTVVDESDFQLLFYRLWAELVHPDKNIETLYWDIYGSKTIIVDTKPKKEKLVEILNGLREKKEIDYKMTDDLKVCRYCTYKIACGRY